MRYCLWFAWIIPLLFTTGCSTNPVTGKRELAFLSEQDEIALGEKLHQDILKIYPLYPEPQLQQYVQTLGDKLAANSHRSNIRFNFNVLDSREVNAFALPGGYVYITRGLLAYLSTESELAAVLGHEIAHITARHSVRQHSLSQITSLFSAAVNLFLDPSIKPVTGSLIQVAGLSLVRGYGRQHELEADRLGATYLARNRYDPQSMLEVIRILKNQERFETQLASEEGRPPRIYHGLFATHPDNDTRLQEVIAHAAQSLPAQELDYLPADKRRFLERIDGLVYGGNCDEGVLRGSQYYHPTLNFSIRFPKDWGINNLKDQVTAISPGGHGSMKLSLQAISELSVPPQLFIKQQLKSKSLRQGQALTIHGQQGYTGIHSEDTATGQQTTRLVVVFLDQYAYTLAGNTKEEAQFTQYDPLFLESGMSLHPISESERTLAVPLRLQIIQADAHTRFHSLAAASPLGRYAEQQLRLLNARYPQGEPTAGEWIKLVQ